jgi:hypothetical protein
MKAFRMYTFTVAGTSWEKPHTQYFRVRVVGETLEDATRNMKELILAGWSMTYAGVEYSLQYVSRWSGHETSLLVLTDKVLVQMPEEPKMLQLLIEDTEGPSSRG